MQRLTVSALTCLTLVAAVTLASAQQPGKDAAAVVQGNNVFALDLYSRLAQEKGNLFVSPYSISNALAMTYAGAKNKTAEEMATTLHFGLEQPRLHAAFAELIRDINENKQRKYQLQVANRLWGQQGFTFLPEFLKTTEAQYRAGFQGLDFKNATEAARKTINGWVEEQTKDKIKELLKPGVLTRDTRLVLTNAIYFKAAWLFPFTEQATKKAPFHLAGGEKAQVQMMHAYNKLGYAENDLMQMVELPYENGELSMLVLLPKKADGLGDLEKALTSARLDEWRGKLQRHQVDLSLPKFKFTSEFSLKKTLSAMGMPTAFDDKKADFTGMTTEAPLYISEVVHKAFVDVNEKGTEAAAATAVIMAEPTSAPPPLPRATFRADRPFVFVIRHQATGSVLFMGRVADPR